VHTPIQASWLNQVEIYFAQIQRKVLTPNDFTSLGGKYSVLSFCSCPQMVVAATMPSCQRMGLLRYAVSLLGEFQLMNC
jgi:hypothetical protein